MIQMLTDNVMAAIDHMTDGHVYSFY